MFVLDEHTGSSRLGGGRFEGLSRERLNNPPGSNRGGPPGGANGPSNRCPHPRQPTTERRRRRMARRTNGYASRYPEWRRQRGLAPVVDNGRKRPARRDERGSSDGDGDGRRDRPEKLEAIISIQDVSKSFGSHTVLQDITFDIPKGKITAILGPSGTGKSVLLKNIIGLLRPEQGEIWVDGENIVGMREKDLYRVRRKFGVLFQDGALFGSLNLYDNIAFPLREHTHKSEKEDMKTTDDKIIRQFLAGRAKGPIGMDEMSDEDATGIEDELEQQEEERMGEPPQVMTV